MSTVATGRVDSPMSAVKVLFSQSHGLLESGLQEFLVQTRGQIRITGVTMDSNEYGHNLVILYNRAPGPEYYGHIYFDRRHDGLEEQTNRALAEAGQWRPELVAVGSNQYGHCLTIIFTAR